MGVGGPGGRKAIRRGRLGGMGFIEIRTLDGEVLERAIEMAPPRPRHTLTEAAADAVEAVRRAGHEARVDRQVAQLVRSVGRPRPSGLDPVTPNARILLALAQRLPGWQSHLLVGVDWCRVEGHGVDDRGRPCGFWGQWRKRAAHAFAWCEPWRYEVVTDDRPVGTRAGTRAQGVPVRRLSLVASPWGQPMGFRALTERLAVMAGDS